MTQVLLLIAGKSPSVSPVTLPLATGCAGTVTIQRDGQAVTLIVQSLTLPSGSGPVKVCDIPSAFLPIRAWGQLFVLGWSSSGSEQVFGVDGSALYWRRSLDGGARPGTVPSGQVQWNTNAAWPT